MTHRLEELRELRDRLDVLHVSSLKTVQVTQLVTRETIAWAAAYGYEARHESRFPAPRVVGKERGELRVWQGRVDLVFERVGEKPLVVEIDRSAKKVSLRKLVHAVDAGSDALWVRWDGPKGLSLPPGLSLVSVDLRARQLSAACVSSPPAAVDAR